MLPFPIITNTDSRDPKYYKKMVLSRINLGILNSDSQNNLYAIGDNSRLGLGVPFTSYVNTISNVDDVWSSTGWSFVLKKDGTYWWSGSSNPFSGLSTTVSWTNISSRFSSIGTIKKAFTTSSAIVVLNTLNEIWVVGGNQYGGYGLGNTTTPTTFTKLNLTNVKNIYGHEAFVDNLFVLYNDGTLVGAGYNGQNLLGSAANPNANTSFITISTDVVDVRVSQYALYIKKSDGTWYVQGSNYSGALGNGIQSGTSDLFPITFSGSGIKELYAGNGCTHIISTDNKLYYAGYHSTSTPISGTNTNSAPWNANVATFTEVPGTDSAIISGIIDIFHYNLQISHFITRRTIYSCGAGGSYQLIPPYGNSTVLGFKVLNSPLIN